jgi:hypothetical protein
MMTLRLLPELQESDDESESWSSSRSSSPSSSCCSLLIPTELPPPPSLPPLQQSEPTPRVLVIGATSASGHEIIRQLSEHPCRPQIHAFCDETTSHGLPIDVQARCTSVVEGSVRHAVDLVEAIENTRVNWVLLCGEPMDNHFPNDSESNNNVMHHHHSRTTAAKNLATALTTTPGLEQVRVMVVSRVRQPLLRRIGGMMTTSFLAQQRDWEEVVDCRGQEDALQQITNPVTIIRTTRLVDHHNSKRSRKLVELPPQSSSSASSIPFAMRCTYRSDLASRVVEELCGSSSQQPQTCRTIHIASWT